MKTLLKLKNKKFKIKNASHRDLYNIVKKLLGRKYRNFIKIKDKEEKTETLKYVLTSHLKLKKLEIETKIMENSKNNSFIKERLLLVDPKIKYFETSLKKSDYDKILKFMEEIEKDV
jgi:ATP-dependent RNA circularization protein (DNA/RNA ligase family)